jgi:hypothetical protein
MCPVLVDQNMKPYRVFATMKTTAHAENPGNVALAK